MQTSTPDEYWNKLLYKDSQAVEEAVWTGCKVANLGGFQDKNGQSTEQLGLTHDPTLSSRLN